MNLDISTSNPAQRGEFMRPEFPPPATGHMLPSSLPQPSILLKKENEPWRGPSAFGLANLLNRSSSGLPPPPSSSSSASSTASSSLPGPPSLPKFNLPALHSFGKPLITKPDPSMNRARSILNDSAPSHMATPSSNSSSHESNEHHSSHHSNHHSHHHSSTTDSRGSMHVLVNESTPSPSTQSSSVSPNETLRKTALSRRIAPAPTEDDENEADDTASDSIRGGRWSADEHERFLAGFRIHGHKWKRVQQVVRTRSVTQVRTHAQKYLLKLAKLKGEKKAGEGDAASGPQSSSDTETATMATIKTETRDTRRSSSSSPKKKQRRHGPTDSVDGEYIAAAATTLCFLMRQKIDSIFDLSGDDEKDAEPLDCYSSEQSYGTNAHSIENSRKRPYMHFIADNTNDYSYGDRNSSRDTSGYSIDGKQLCS